MSNKRKRMHTTWRGKRLKLSCSGNRDLMWLERSVQRRSGGGREVRREEEEAGSEKS